MKVEVLIERDRTGRLHGYVLERRTDGYCLRGSDILTRHVFRRVDSAVQEIDGHIMRLFKLIEPPEIHYTFPLGFRND